MSEQRPYVLVHPAVVRLCHWVNAIAIFIMVLSGWRIRAVAGLERKARP